MCSICASCLGCLLLRDNSLLCECLSLCLCSRNWWYMPPRDRWCPGKAIRVLEREKKMFFLTSRKFIKMIFSSLIFLCCSVLNEKCLWYLGPLNVWFSVGDSIWVDVKRYGLVGGSAVLEVALRVLRLGLFLVCSLSFMLWFKLEALCFLLACLC